MKQKNNWRKILNKKAYYSFDDVGMFFLSFLIIIVGIIIGLNVFYSQNYDIREEEAKVIAFKLVKGILNENKIKEDILSDNFDIFKESKIDKNIINNGEYFFRLEIYEQDNLIKTFVEGNRDLEIFCELKTKDKGCFSSEYYYGNFKFKVLTASDQNGKNV